MSDHAVPTRAPVLPRPRLREPPPLAPLSPPPADAPAEPTVEVVIGRIEWRAQVPPTPPPAAPRPARTTGFAAYAALRTGVDRSRR